MPNTRNRNAGKHPSYEKRGMSEEAIAKKKAYDKKNNAKEKSKNYREELNRENRRRGTYGNGDGKDLSHTKSGKLVQESQSKNRARNGSGGKAKRK